MLWVVLMILPLLVSKSSDELLHHAPDDAVSIVTVNNREIIERFLFDALYGKGFSTNELEQLDYNKEDFEVPSSGIDLRENVVIFQTSYKKETITGFIFNLMDPQDFSNFNVRDHNEVKYFNEDIGCILMVPERSLKSDRLYFEAFAKKVVNERREQLPDHLTNVMNDEQLVNLFYRGHENTYIQNLELSAKINGSSIFFEGRGDKNPQIKYESGTYTQLKSPGQEPYLEVRAGQLPDSVYSYFDVITRNFHVELPEITSQQIFFYGIMIDNIDGSTAFLPKFDGIFRFKDSVDITVAVDSLIENEKKVHRQTSKTVKIGELDYHFKQLSPMEVAVGITPSLELDKIDKAPLPLIQGNPAATINIEGEGIIAQIAQMLPPVKYSKKLFNDLEYFELHTEEGGDGTLILRGEMRFPEKEKASLELFKYLMKF